MSFAFNIPFRVEKDVPSKTPYIETLGQTDSFWSAPVDRLGVRLDLEDRVSFGYDVDLYFDEDYPTDGYGIFGFTKNSGFYSYNMRSLTQTDLNVYVWAPRTVVSTSSSSTKLLVTPSQRHLLKFRDRPTEGGSESSVEVDDVISLFSTTGTSYMPYNYPMYFGGNLSSATATSVSRQVKMKVYGMKVYQDGDITASLVPSVVGGIIGMTNELNGDFFPANNCIYGEE